MLLIGWGEEEGSGEVEGKDGDAVVAAGEGVGGVDLGVAGCAECGGVGAAGELGRGGRAHLAHPHALVP